MEIIFKQKEKTIAEMEREKVEGFANSLAIYFTRIGKDENGNPLFEANKFPILDIIGKYKTDFLFTLNMDWFYRVTTHTLVIQSYSLKTDLYSMAENILNGKFNKLY